MASPVNPSIWVLFRPDSSQGVPGYAKGGLYPFSNLVQNLSQPIKPSPAAVRGDRSAAISSSCSKAARRSSTISSAIWFGGGRLAESSMLSSRSQKMSRLALSRFIKVVVAEAAEAFGLLALVTSLRVVARYEVVQVSTGQRVGLEREAMVGPQIVYPQVPGSTGSR